MTTLSWPAISCWLAAELAGLRDKRPAILGDFLALAQDGHVEVTASAEMYTLHRTSEQAPEVPFERVELLEGLFYGPDCYLLRADARGPFSEVSDRIGLEQLREAGRRSSAAHAFTRPVLGLTAAGKAQRQRVRELPAQIRAAHHDPRAAPWARLFLDDNEFLGWYRAHLAATGPPGWLLWSEDLAPETTDPMAPQGIEGLFEVLLHAVTKSRRKLGPSRRSDFDRPFQQAPAEAGSAAAGVTDADAARDLLERLRDSGDKSAIADAEVVARQVDEKLAEGIRLSRLGRQEEAVGPLAEAMAMSSLLTDPDLDRQATTQWHRAMLRRAGRVHWRYVVSTHALGRYAEALDAGQRAVWCYQTAKDCTPAGSAELTEHTAEFMTVLTDVAEAAAAVGETVMSLTLIAEGIRVGAAEQGVDQGVDQAILRAYGTLLHNKASTITDAVVADSRAGRPDRYAIGEAGAAIAEAADIRERLAGLDVLAAWELANTLLLAAQIAALTRNGRIAVEVFCRAGAICGQLGSAADALADRLLGIGELLVATAPEEVAAARAAGRWPLA